MINLNRTDGRDRFRDAVKTYLLYAELNNLHTTKRLDLSTQLTKMPDQFVCICGDKQLAERTGVSVNGWGSVPKCSVKQKTFLSPEMNVSTRNPASSISKYMVFGHQTDPDQASQVTLNNCNSRSLAFCEALSIKRLKRPLCTKTVAPQCVPTRESISRLSLNIFPSLSMPSNSTVK